VIDVRISGPRVVATVDGVVHEAMLDDAILIPD
jgi:hypothetical protein